MRIGIDIDDTLGDLHTVVKPIIKEKFNVDYDREELHSYCLEESLGLPAHEIMEVFNNYHSDECINIKPLDGAVQCMKKLHVEYDVNIITARCSSSIENTQKWLLKHQIPYHALVFAQNKWDICRHMGISIMVEDKGETAIRIAESGIMCILLDYAWNRKYNHELIHRVNNWEQIYKTITQHLPVAT